MKEEYLYGTSCLLEVSIVTLYCKLLQRLALCMFQCALLLFPTRQLYWIIMSCSAINLCTANIPYLKLRIADCWVDPVYADAHDDVHADLCCQTCVNICWTQILKLKTENIAVPDCPVTVGITNQHPADLLEFHA